MLVLRKQERAQRTIYNFTTQELEEEQETKLQGSERKEKINISGQINETQNSNTTEKINKKIGS